MTFHKVTLAFSLFVAILSVSNLAVAQSKNKKDSSCDNMLFEATAYYQEKKFSTATSLLLKTEYICKEFNAENYLQLISSLKNAINQEQNHIDKTALIDTLIAVYKRAETKKYYSQKDDLVRASFILNSTKPDHQEADKLFFRGLMKTGSSAGETVLTLYYFNLYTCYLNAESNLKVYYKKRLVDAYFMLNDWGKREKLSEKTVQIVDLYFNNTIRNCTDILSNIPEMLEILDQNSEPRFTELTNLKIVLEKRSCSNSEEYELIIDSLLSTKETTENWLIKAEIYRKSNDYPNELKALISAKNYSINSDELDSISLLMAKVNFNSGNYITSYKQAIELKNIKNGAGLKLAAENVAANAKNCGRNLEEQQLNFYHASSLLAEAKKQGADITELDAIYTTNFPNQQALNKLGLKPSQSIKLACWEVTIKIP